MKYNVKIIFSFLAAVIGSFCVQADDVAGLMRVESDTNGEATVEMPFTPFGDRTIPTFLSGTFLGDGGVGSDRLWRIALQDGATTNAVYASGEWIDPADGLASSLTASRGDMLVLASGDGEQFGFWLRGRVAPRAGWPFISGLSVDSDEGFADLSVSTGGYPADVFTLDTGEEAPDWTYLGRWPGYPQSFAWRDTSLADMSNETSRVYLVSDASRDTDGDGIPDALERHVYGTSPLLRDTDGDGVVDGLEIAWGSDPLVADQPLPFAFSEPFEPPSVQPGPIDGQNGWLAASTNSAVVQGECVHAGDGALRMEAGREVDAASRVIDCDASVVWADLYMTASRGGEDLLTVNDSFAAYAFDEDGHPITTDGNALVTNLHVAVASPARWVRCTCRFDFPNRCWDFYLDGILIAGGLALRGTAAAFHEFATRGDGHLDDLRVSTERPQGLSSDGDALPDEWEIRHFGTLARDGSGDADGDGMSDLAECRAGTDPLVPSWDTDGDGLPDWWEVANGLDPLSSEWKGTVVFSELFERPSVEPGELAGQNGWRVTRLGTALVQESVVHSGSGALHVKGGSVADGEEVSVSRLVDFGDDVLWSDLRIRSSLGSEGIQSAGDAFAAYAFDSAGHPVMVNGGVLTTNLQVRVADEDGWVRCTCRFDFVGRRWDFYMDGVIVGKNLAMRGTARALREIALAGGAGFLDDWNLSTERPQGLSSDGDAIPDEWEFVHFGTLGRDGTGDADEDGLADLDEWRIGTDPNVADTDGDGMPDGWEAANGLAPLDPADVSADPDGDGVPNGDEYAHGGDPRLPEPDPRTRQPGLRTEFWRTAGKQATMPAFDELLPSTLGVLSCVDMPATPWRDGAAIGNYFACRLDGFIRIPADGRYTFHLASNAGAVMTFDGETLVSDPAAHSTRTRSASRNLARGFYPVSIAFYKNTGSESLVLEWEGPGLEREVVPASAFCHLPVAEILPTGYAQGLFFADAETSGALRAPLTGTYRLTASSAKGFRLWLDGTLLVDCFSSRGTVSRAVTLPIAAGLHDIRVEHAAGASAVTLSWSCGGTPSEAVPERFLLHAVSPEAADRDGDGMPDWWEERHGLDPVDPSDAALDPDGDGLSSLAEFRAGTDPHKPDTDGDGMPDAWEVAHGTCPFLHDALSDPDGDGLANIEEYALGTGVLNADTDGDGCPDGQEVRNVRSNPLVADIYWTSPADVGDAIPGAAVVGSTGTWRTEADGTVYAAERAGSLEWRLSVPTGGVDALAVRIGQHEFYSKASTFDLSLKVDGVFVSRLIVSAPYGTTTDACFFLPEIPSGGHDFVLVWHNWEVNTFLAVHDLRFVRFGGPDENGNGVADWHDSRAAAATALDVLPYESLVSPLCVEGRDLWRDVLEVEVGYPDTNATFGVVKTVGDGFYVDVPLVEAGETLITLADRGLTNSYPVVWTALDVFAGNYASNALAIRTGDSLRIAGYGDSSCTVTVSRATADGEWTSVTNWTQTTSTSYLFDEPGLHLVSVSADGWFGPHVAHALVEVVSSRFPKRNPAVQMDRAQVLDCPALSPRNLLEHDSELDVSASVVGNGVSLELLTHANRDLGLVSRLDENGPISDAVQVTPVWFDNGTYYHVAQVYPDGSQLVEVSFLFGGLPDGMTVKLEIFVSGVTFEDGTRTKILTVDDMDENGHCTVRFIRARGVTTSVCHRTYLYQDGQLIYTNK